MDVTLRLEADELIQAFHDFLPMRLLLGEVEAVDDPAWLQIDDLDTVTFVAGHGLRLTCPARIHYPMPLVPSDFTVKHVTLEVVPRIVDAADGPLLAFALEVDDLDIKYLPEFVERSVVSRINAALTKHATSIAWNFGETLTQRIHLPRRLELVRGFSCSAPEGRVEVAEDHLTIGFSLRPAFHHVADGAAEREPSDT